MTVKNDIVLWDNGIEKLCLLKVPNEQQYKYIEGVPCITFGIFYENANFKGCDTFTLFDHFYSSIVNEMKNTYISLNGSFRIYDVGADTDGYIEFVMKNGKLFVEGQLGASFSTYSLTFEFEADQTLVGNLLQEITC